MRLTTVQEGPADCKLVRKQVLGKHRPPLARQLVVACACLLTFGTPYCAENQAKPAESGNDDSGIICSLAPSQSETVRNAASSLGGAAATALALAKATGLSVVTHSSGALILTGSSGYVAGTLGAGALAGPIILGTAVVVAGTAITVELYCAPVNHPEEVSRVKAAATEFLNRSKMSFLGIKTTAIQEGKSLKASVVKVAGDTYDYAFRRSSSSSTSKPDSGQ